jgi:nanoRNase/pAp phosphatase (c-di-AMP/oligoRNAs hydrolase)
MIYKVKIVNFQFNDEIYFPVAIINTSILQNDTANFFLRHQSRLHTSTTVHFAITYTFRDPSIDDFCGFRIRCEDVFKHPSGEIIGADDIAQRFGGGGHAEAAGFYCSSSKFFERTFTEKLSRRTFTEKYTQKKGVKTWIVCGLFLSQLMLWNLVSELT